MAAECGVNWYEIPADKAFDLQLLLDPAEGWKREYLQLFQVITCANLALMGSELKCFHIVLEK